MVDVGYGGPAWYQHSNGLLHLSSAMICIGIELVDTLSQGEKKLSSRPVQEIFPSLCGSLAASKQVVEIFADEP